nr:dehydrogenase/reductase SDR family member 12 isoform X3 [Agelaius phoeniceus]
MVNNRELTEDGLEKNFATNTLGTYIMTTALVPLLEKAADARVITVSSGGMLVQKLNVSDLQSESGTFDGTMVYAQNKRQQVVLTEQWAKAHRNIHFSVMHPGWADTPVRNGIGRGTSDRSCCQFCPCNLTQTNKWWIIWRLSAILPQAILLPDRGKYSLSSISSRDASPSYTQNGNLKLVWFLVLVCLFVWGVCMCVCEKSLAWQATIPLLSFPAVRSSMPDFYERMKNSLRTEAQGADTVLWLAVSAEATKLPSGLFFQDRQPVPTHLPLAYTHSPPEDEEKLMEVLEEFSQKFKSASPGI